MLQSAFTTLKGTIPLLRVWDADRSVSRASLVVGHTDNTGSESYNMTLSEKRAKSVTSYLISDGIASNRFETLWYGETQPKYDNSTAEGRAKNRRVNVAIVPNDKMKKEAQQEAEKIK